MQHIPVMVPIRVDGVDLCIAASVYAPDEHVQAAPVIWFCLPGATFTRRYYDLQRGDDDSRSFAAAMTGRGHIAIALDPLGVGDSEAGDEDHALDMDFIIQVHAAATAALKRGLCEGSLGLPPIATPTRIIGVGQSMGGMLITMQQAAFASFDSIVLLGTSVGGLESMLTAEERRYSNDPAAARAAIGTLTRQRFGSPILSHAPEGAPPSAFAGEDAPWTAVVASAMGGLLATSACLCLIPGGFAPDCAQVTVPVFLGIGAADLEMPIHEAPAFFTGSADITLLVLPDTGHMHFGFATTPSLFERLARWAIL